MTLEDLFATIEARRGADPEEHPTGSRFDHLL